MAAPVPNAPTVTNTAQNVLANQVIPSTTLPPVDVTAQATGNILYFPADLPVGLDTGSSNTAAANAFCMKLMFSQYSRPSLTAAVSTPWAGSIYLPIPDALTDSQGVTYTTEKLESALGATMNSIAAGGGVGANITAGLEGGITALLNNAAGNLAAAANKFLGIGIPTGQAGAATLQLWGFAINPFLTVQLQGPQFRKFSFTWKLAPTSAQESAMLKSIVQYIKSYMLPSLAGGASDSGVLLSYPYVCQPVISPDIGFYFKNCVIDSVQLNYAPGATPSFFKVTNQPTVVYLTVSLQEIEFWLSNGPGQVI